VAALVHVSGRQLHQQVVAAAVHELVEVEEVGEREVVVHVTRQQLPIEGCCGRNNCNLLQGRAQLRYGRLWMQVAHH
jgi:hypothetical protein